MTEHWDNEAIYDEQISPLISKIIAICKEHKMPAVLQVQFCDREDGGPGFCTTTLPFEGRTAEKMTRLTNMSRPERPVVLAETTITNPDGSKEISIRRMQ